jgi:hypothetical protein
MSGTIEALKKSRWRDSAATISRKSLSKGVLRRKCACGGNPGVDGACESCRNQRMSVQRQQTNGSSPEFFAPIVDGVFHPANQRLDVDKRASFERTSGHDFQRIRVHSEIRRERTLSPTFIGEVEEVPALAPGTGPSGATTGTAAPSTGGGCPDICNRAYANASLNSGGGGVICDGVTKCPCVFDVPPLLKGQCPGFDAIVRTHETRHLPDVDCNPAGGLHRPPFRNPAAANSSECAHRRQSIAEMDRIIPIAAGVCKTGMVSIRSDLNTWVTGNCGGGTSSP